MDGQTRRRVCAFFLLFLLLLALTAANLLAGTVPVTPAELLRVLRAQGEVGSTARVVWTLRLPRLTAAAFLGGALAVSGFLLQTFFYNPIAGPFVLGVSSGAKLTVALTRLDARDGPDSAVLRENPQNVAADRLRRDDRLHLQCGDRVCRDLCR